MNVIDLAEQDPLRTLANTDPVGPSPESRRRHLRRLQGIARRREAIHREQVEAALAAREEGLNLREIAAALGISHSAVWKWEQEAAEAAEQPPEPAA
jgi:DNA-directed RNA polymerase specialized sigma24 family protein